MDHCGGEILFGTPSVSFQRHVFGASNWRFSVNGAKPGIESSGESFMLSAHAGLFNAFSNELLGIIGAVATDWHMAVTPVQRKKVRNVNLIGLPPQH
jgi:hypothetical protein